MGKSSSKSRRMDEKAFNLFFTFQAGKITYKYCDALQKA